jgi:hypothetical protein
MPDEFLIAEEAKPEAETEETETVASEARLAAARGKFKLEAGHERGIGSRHHNLHPAHKAHLAAIEHLITVEAEHAAAEAHLATVHAKVQRAMAQVEVTEKASNDELAEHEET